MRNWPPLNTHRIIVARSNSPRMEFMVGSTMQYPCLKSVLSISNCHLSWGHLYDNPTSHIWGLPLPSLIRGPMDSILIVLQILVYMCTMGAQIIQNAWEILNLLRILNLKMSVIYNLIRKQH
jgi:hypothetical protein